MSDPITTPAAPAKLTLLKFTASWCGPCQTMAPTLKAFAKDHPEVTVTNIDVDTVKGSNKADTFRVQGIPTLVLLNEKGETVWRKVGVVGRKALDNALAKAREKERTP